MDRKYYLDNIRWATVLLVVVYHVFYLFNAAGVLGGIGSFSEVQYQDALLYFVYPWFMVLLFLIAGISARYALARKPVKKFIGERTRKLLVPSTLGLLVYQWIIGYFYCQIGEGLEGVPGWVVYLIAVLSGTGPLWFIQELWIFSLLAALLHRLDKKDKLYSLCGKYDRILLALSPLLLWGSAQVLNMPVITVYRFGIYPMAFFMGYLLFSHEEVQEKVAKIHLPALVVALVSGTAYTIYYFGSNYTEDACLKSAFTNFYIWFTLLAIMGCGKAWFDKESAFSRYMTQKSFGIYVLHYLFMLVVCYVLKSYTVLPAVAVYPAGIAAGVGGGLLCFELFRRIPVWRYLVLGIRVKKL